MRYLLTQSLLSSWKYAIRENPFAEEAEDPWADFVDTLKKVERPASDSMLKGIQFESLVNCRATDRLFVADSPYEDAVERFGAVCFGGVLQYTALCEETVNGVPLLLYGRMDCLKGGVIYDIKYSGHYDKGKFFDSPQHPMYLHLVPEATEFTYLVSNGSATWEETYRRDETPDIIPLISDFLGWLEAVRLMDTYRENWTAKE